MTTPGGSLARPMRGAAEAVARERPPLAAGVLGALALAKLALHVHSATLAGYGYMPDELYFLACADRLDWGFVDHPPFSIGVLWVVRELIGDSLLALRVVPALLGAATLFVTGLLARELGGGRLAQGIAGLAVLVGPSFLAMGSYYSLNAFDQLLWPLVALALARMLHGGDRRGWLFVGAAIGLGLLNKMSVLWLAFGLGIGIALTPQRRWLATPWPWLGAALALALWAPHVLWQWEHGWPTLEFIAGNQKEYRADPIAFLVGQVEIHHPLTLPLWLAGLASFLATARHRLLAWIWLGPFLLLLLSGRASAYYLTPAYPVLFAGGAIALERLARRQGWRWLPAVASTLLLIGGAALAPLALPLVSPERYLSYERVTGLAGARESQVADSGLLPFHFAIRFGWPELARSVARVHQELPEAERAQAAILATSFGEAAALEFYAPRLGLPRVVGTHVGYGFWGPGGVTGEVMIVVASPGAAILQQFADVETAGNVDCRYCLPELASRRVYICRRPRRPLAELWPALRSYR